MTIHNLIVTAGLSVFGAFLIGFIIVLIKNRMKKQSEKKKYAVGGETPKPEEPVLPKEPKEETYRVAMKIHLVNNKTDKQYTIESENEFGFRWNYVRTSKEYTVLAINQRLNIHGTKWNAVARLHDFSIAKVEFQEFTATA